MKMAKKIFSGILAVILIVSFMPIDIKAAQAVVGVDETAYVNMDYYGRISKISIVKGCDINGNTDYTDYGEYDKVTNMSNEIEPTVSADSVSWKLDGYKGRFYYECTPKSGTVILPWDFDISYKLNGVPINADKLAGASGLIEINITAKPNDKTSEYLKNNMLLTVEAIFDMSKTISIEAPGAQVQAAGNYKAVLFAGLPGEENNYTMRIGSNCFETTGIMMTMMPATLDQLKDIKELKKSKDTIEDSKDALYDSLNKSLSIIQSTSDGLKRIQSGLSSLNDARKTISSSKAGVYDNADKLLADLPAITSQMDELIPHLQNGQQLLKDVNSDINVMVNTIESVKPDIEAFSTSVSELQKDVDKLNSILNTAKGYSGDRKKLIEEINDDIDTTQKTLTSLESVTKTMGSDLLTLTSDLRKLNTALESMPNELNSTSQQLKAAAENAAAAAAAAAPQAAAKAATDAVSALPAEAPADTRITTAITASTIAANTASSAALPISTTATTMGVLNTELAAIFSSLQPTIDSLGDVSNTTKSLVYEMRSLCAEGSDIMGTAKNLVSLADDYFDSINAGIGATQDLLDETKTVGDTAKKLLDKSKTLIDNISGLNSTMNKYIDGAVDTLKDSENLINKFNSGLTDTNVFLSSLEAMLKESGKNLDEGTRKSVEGLIEVLQKGLEGISTTSTTKKALDTINNTIDDKLDEITDNSNLLEIDAEALPVSFTSPKNSSPNSIQIVARTAEISVEDNENSVDLEVSGEKVGFVSRITQVFVTLWRKITSIFS
jgi:predicted  nucleic acid-binding Zn-ribbon protein